MQIVPERQRRWLKRVQSALFPVAKAQPLFFVSVLVGILLKSKLSDLRVER